MFFVACVNGPSSTSIEIEGASTGLVPTTTASSASEQKSEGATSGQIVPAAGALTTPPISRPVQPVTPASQPPHGVSQGPLPPG